MPKTKYKPMTKRDMKNIISATLVSLNSIYEKSPFKIETDGYNAGGYVFDIYVLNKETKKSCKITIHSWEP